jgi:hypothetical protein
MFRCRAQEGYRELKNNLSFENTSLEKTRQSNKYLVIPRSEATRNLLFLGAK